MAPDMWLFPAIVGLLTAALAGRALSHLLPLMLEDLGAGLLAPLLVIFSLTFLEPSSQDCPREAPALAMAIATWRGSRKPPEGPGLWLDSARRLRGMR